MENNNNKSFEEGQRLEDASDYDLDFEVGEPSARSTPKAPKKVKSDRKETIIKNGRKLDLDNVVDSDDNDEKSENNVKKVKFADIDEMDLELVEATIAAEAQAEAANLLQDSACVEPSKCGPSSEVILIDSRESSFMQPFRNASDLVEGELYRIRLLKRVFTHWGLKIRAYCVGFNINLPPRFVTQTQSIRFDMIDFEREEIFLQYLGREDSRYR